jgi:hypothetical protein
VFATGLICRGANIETAAYSTGTLYTGLVLLAMALAHMGSGLQIYRVSSRSPTRWDLVRPHSRCARASVYCFLPCLNTRTNSQRLRYNDPMPPFALTQTQMFNSRE